MVSITLLQVGSRFITGNSFVWVEEISRYLLICISLFGTVAVYGNKAMIRLTFFQDTYPVSFKKYVDLVIKVFLLIFYFFFIKESFISVHAFALRKSPSMGVPLSLFFLVVPVSQICVVVLIVLDMIALCLSFCVQSQNQGKQ